MQDRAVSDQTDEDLYQKLRKGDRRALEQLYERHEPALYRYALHMSGSRFVAEEVAQEVFMQLIVPNQGYNPKLGALEPYLYGVARNRLRMLRRTRPTEALQDLPGKLDLLTDLLKNEARAALYESLQKLPDRYRDAVVLCDLEERSYQDAAKLMGCPVGTVRSRLHRARLLLGAASRMAVLR